MPLTRQRDALFMRALNAIRLGAQHSRDIEQLFRQAEETSENLVRGNQLLDSAAKHSRDFRLLVLSFLITASFALLFLDWWYD